MISLPAQPPFQKPTLIVNLYNDSQTYSATEQLHDILQRHLRIDNYDTVLVCGDFNLHHALWNQPGYTEEQPQAQTLVETMMEANLRPLLPPGTITRTSPHRNPTQSPTAIDLVWGNDNASNILIKCHTVQETQDHGSDHHPIEIILDLSPKKLPPRLLLYDYNKTNWDLVKIELECLLPPLLNPSNATPEELDNYALALTAAYREAIDKHNPRKRPCPHCKRWWNDDLSALRKQANRLRNRYRRTHDERVGEE